MREVNVAIVLLEQDGHYLLQLRPNDPKRGGAGKIGCFGGAIEAGESAEQAARRELSEETTFDPVRQAFSHIGEVNVIGDKNLEPVKACLQVYHVILDKAADLKAVEGELIHVMVDEVKDYLDKMTTGTRACFEQLVLQEK